MSQAEVLGELEPYWMPFSPNKEFKREPRMIVRAEGMYLYAPDGRALIDASAGLFCVAAGHCRPEIAEAVYRQLKTLDYACITGSGVSRSGRSSYRASVPITA
jgi:beta-alanine--pyruvate transaminase